MKKILYWPGMRFMQNELLFLLNELEKNNKIIKMSEKYDIGPLPFKRNSKINVFLENEEYCEWWMGLSLGASVAYILSSSVEMNKKPKRLTLINMFHDREILSIRKGFTLNKQWNLKPINHVISKDIKVDLVISEDDDKIEPIFGLEMLKQLNKNNLNLLRIKADHSISNKIMQKKLAQKLKRI